MTVSLGTQALVRNWYSVRSLRLSRSRRRGLFPGYANGARFREGQRNLLPSGNHLQTAAEVQPEFGGMFDSIGANEFRHSRYIANTSFVQCFKYIVTDPPRPLTEEDIWFQIGHVHEQQKDVSR